MTRMALLFAVLVAFATPARSQDKSAIGLPTLMRTAESYALGDGAASLEGLGAIGVNPAGLAVRRPEALAQHQPMPLQTSLSMFGFAYPVQRLKTTLGLNYLWLRSSGFDGRDAAGQPTGSFSDDEKLLALSVARPFRLGAWAEGEDGAPKPLLLGATAKHMRLKIGNDGGSANALDVGARYTLAAAPLSLGVAALNLGSGPRLRDERSPLPLTYVLSASLRPTEGMMFLASASRHVPERRMEMALGAQLGMGGVLAVRGRYAMLQGNVPAHQGIQNVSGGFGLTLFDGKTLDYAFQVYEDGLRQAGATGTHRLTMTFRFGRSMEEGDSEWESPIRSGTQYRLPKIEGVDRGRTKVRRKDASKRGTDIWRTENTSATWQP